MITIGERGMAFLLCLLIGIFGAHRFFVKKWKTGLFMLLTTFISSGSMLVFTKNGINTGSGSMIGMGIFTIPMTIVILLWIIDFFMILFGFFKDKDGYYVADW